MKSQDLSSLDLYGKSDAELAQLWYARTLEWTKQVIRIVQARNPLSWNQWWVNYRLVFNELIVKAQSSIVPDSIVRELLHIILREYIVKYNNNWFISKNDLREIIYILDRHDYAVIQGIVLNLLATIQWNTFISNYIAQYWTHETVKIIILGLLDTRLKIIPYLRNWR